MMTEYDENLDEDSLDISMGEGHRPGMTPLPDVDEPSVQPERPRSPWDADQPASSLTGPFDAWLAEVIEAPYTGNPHVQGVAVDRCDIEWLANNQPNAIAVAPVESQNTPSRRIALPYIPMHDQEKYHVQAGDIVTCVTGRDGRCYFFSDSLPFIGWVIDSTASTADNTEKWNGKAANETITVRRQAMTEDVDSADYADHGATLADLETAASATVDYGGVRIIAPEGTHHGYRLSDMVLVTRRGRYMYCQPARENFLAKVQATGPLGTEDNFTDNRYWVIEQDGIPTYDGSKYTLALTDRARNVTGQNGFAARIVMAYNYGESSTEHKITTGETVLVTLFSSTASTREPFYIITRTVSAEAGKSAIELLHGQWRALFCRESPEWRFDDIVRGPLEGVRSKIQLDPLYVQACLLNTIEVVSLVPKTLPKGRLAARVEEFHVVVESTCVEDPAVPVVVTVSGYARGCSGRFPIRTEQQAHANLHFWRQAYGDG